MGGHVLHSWVLHRFVPFYSDDFVIDQCSHVPAGEIGVATGIELRIHPDRVVRMLHGVSMWTMLAPSGIVPRECVLRGHWKPRDDTGQEPVPVTVVIDTAFSPVPCLRARLPVGIINRKLEVQAERKWRKTREWFLGHYEEISRASFRYARISSETNRLGSPVHRTLFFDAAGEYQLRLEDSLLKASSTAHVSQLSGAAEMDFRRSISGVEITYEARINSLKAAVDNLAPWAEVRVAENLRKSFEKSLNRQKNKDKLRGKHFAAWFPFDANVDIVFE